MQNRSLILAVPLLALLAVGCGSSSPPRPSSTGSQSANNPAAAAYKYAGCMRDHGVTSFPDPQVTTTPGGGSASIRQVVPASVGQSPQFKSAQKACASIMPGPGPGSPGQTAAQQHAHEQILFVFARCLRGHGVPKFPDPTSQGRLNLQAITAAGVDLQAPSFLTAAKACVGVTHGAITLADVEAAINHASSTGSTGTGNP